MPSERGRLIVEFEIDFPGPEFVTEAVRAQLEKILPPVPEFVLPAGSASKPLAEVRLKVVSTASSDNPIKKHVAVDYVAREEE